MSNLSNRSISIYIDQTAASVALQQLQRRADQLTQSIAAGQAAGRNMSNEIRRLADTQTSIRAVQDQLDRGLKPTLTQQKNLVTQLRNELGRMSESDPRFAERLRNYQAQNAELQRMRANIEGVNNSQGSLLTRAGAFAAGFLANMATQAVSFVTSAVSSLFSMNAAFEKSVQNLSAITGATGKDLDYLKNQAIELSKTGKQSATDYVEAFKLIASAKPELLGAREDLVNVTKAAKMLADSAGLELPDAATRLTDALNQFGAPAADAGKYVDALAAASKYGAAEVPEVTEALLKFGAQAKSSNIDIYESSGAIELLAEKGIKGAEAGTQLRNVFLALNAVGALPKSAIDALAQAGVNTDILKNKSLSLEDRLKELSKIQNNSTALVQVFGKENFNAAQILLQSLPRYSELTAQIKEQGVAAKQAAVNTDNLSDQWERFKNVLSARFLDGDNTFLKRLVKDLTETIEPTKSASEQFYELSKNVVHLQTDIVPLTTRYEELKKKANELGGVTKLTADEQAEMKSIINQIIEVVPGAATEFDKYGNAIAISTDRVYEFITAETARLKMLNKNALEDYADKLQDVNDKLKNQKIIMDLIAAGKYKISESTSTGGGGYITESRKASQDEIAKQEKKYKDLLSDQLGIQKEIEKLNGNELAQQLGRANVIKQLEEMLSKLKEGTKEYINLQNEINKIQGLPAVATGGGNGGGSGGGGTDDKATKKLEKARKDFENFIKGIDESILNNQIPEHAKPLIAALQRMADETDKLDEIAKVKLVDGKKVPTNITAEQYAEGGKKILLEYKTFLQKFVEDEAKNFKAPVNASTIADGQLTPTADKPKVDLPLNINTDVTPEEEKALKEKLDKLDKKLKDDLKKQEENREAKFELIDAFVQDAQTAINVIGKLGQAQANNEQRALQQELKANDTKKAALQRQLNQRLISQQEYQIQVSKLDAEAAKKQDDLNRQQFERSKKLQIAQAIANGAMAVTSTLAARPGATDIITLGAFRAIQIGIAVATTAAEIAAIAKQKYAAGGKVEKLSDGKITAQQNVSTQSNGDNVLAYVKQGEVILNEKQQAALGGDETFRRIGVPGFSTGGVVKPAYTTRSYQAINFAAATQSITATKHFATGGVVKQDKSDSPATDPALLALLQSNQSAIENLTYNVAQLQDTFSKPIVATANISLNKIEDATAQKNRIMQNATFK